jgi:signal transduction histidine kinase/ActR/RegA family two-component response regulator
MIVAGSGLMVYNIIRYGTFVKNTRDLSAQSTKSGMLIVPLLLLVFFLIGYVAVGVSGVANLLMASILLGGSIFVFLLLMVMFSIIRHLRDTDQVLSHRYEEMRAELAALTRDSLAAFLVNLTRDEVEDRGGEYLYDSDYATDVYSELLRARAEYVLESDYAGAEQSIFRREELLRRYQEGQTSVSRVLLVRRRDGEACYVRFEATLSKMPVTGDVVAFIVENPCNEAVVQRTLLEDVLMDQYDRIAYLVDGKYRVIISNAGKKAGLLLPDDEEDTYESLYLNNILPAMIREGEAAAGPNPLRLSVIDKALAENRVYDVSAPFFLDGQKRYKHIVFYRIDMASKFYLMLVSDSTSLQEEQAASNRRLTDALADAVHAKNARSVFFARVSHDLHKPVEGILHCAARASASEDPAEVRGCMEQIGASGRRLETLLEDLFAMSSIDSGEMALEEKPVDLRAFAAEIMEHFAGVRPEKKLRLAANTAELRENVVFCDEERLRRVLGRLLENSCAFAPEGTDISLSVVQGEESGDGRVDYRFCIRNRGTAIPADAMNSIFEENGWAGIGEREELPGVGLGMAVAKAFVDAMGGTIRISSGEDGDTRVAIDFAFRPAPPAAKAETPEETPVAEALHVLLVDDNELNREIGELMLTGEGWTVVLAADGAEAVKAVDEAPSGAFDLVLMDVNMPVMNGCEATAAIRAMADPRKAALPIIALTAGSAEESAGEAAAAGMSGFASKPIDPEAIRRELARIRSASET